MAENRVTIGDPIWVESCMTREEHIARYKSGLGSSILPLPVEYDPKHHKGGKWREGMGRPFTEQQIKTFNKGIDMLRELLQTKPFQRRPEYGTHAEAKP